MERVSIYGFDALSDMMLWLVGKEYTFTVTSKGQEFTVEASEKAISDWRAKKASKRDGTESPSDTLVSVKAEV